MSHDNNRQMQSSDREIIVTQTMKESSAVTIVITQMMKKSSAITIVITQTVTQPMKQSSTISEDAGRMGFSRVTEVFAKTELDIKLSKDELEFSCFSS